jgi:predicted acetyltransferase
MLTLRILNEKDEEAFKKGFQEWAGEDSTWCSFIWEEGMSFSIMLQKLAEETQGIHLAPGRVAHTMLYGFVDGEIVGRVSVRHELNDFLLKRGGNVGYAVAPRFRRKGYATEMLRQGLLYCKKIGLDKVLITCENDNVPSCKIIEKNGGVFENYFLDENEQAIVRRYWVKIMS